MRIGIDMDGVLADFFTGYQDLIVDVSGEDRFPGKFPEFVPPVWNWPELYGYEEKVIRQVWKEINESSRFWRSLKPLPGAEDFLARLNMEDPEHVFFITDRPGQRVQFQTALWLQRYGYPLASVIVTPRAGMKGEIADALDLDWFIDDKPSNCLDVYTATGAPTKVRMLDYLYNQGECPEIVRVKSLKDFAEEIFA